MTNRTRNLVIAVLTATALLVGLSPATAGAGVEQVPEITGEVTCDNGDAVIDWTLTNFFDFDIAHSGGAMSVNSATPVALTFSPDPLPALGTSTAQATVSGAEVGTAVATVILDLQGPFEVFGTVLLEGCDQPTTTTTSTPATTTTVAPAAQALAVAPTFTG